MLRLLVVFLTLVLGGGSALAFDHQHQDWNRLLQRHVKPVDEGRATQVDYRGLQRDQRQLEDYLNALSAVPSQEFARWEKDEQLAFLINAYNAFTVKLILSKYPELESIRDLGGFFSSPWKQKFFTLLGKPRHLDEVEHELIRQPGVYNEPRIHFAVNCASIGCPALLNEAYVAGQLDAQLTYSTGKFLADRSRNRYNAASNRLEVSQIFDWYGEDFARGWGGVNSLRDFFRQHAERLTTTSRDAERLRSGSAKITFLSYDWGLNDIAR